MKQLPCPILVSGGAGYIGSHVVRAIGAIPKGLTVIDDFSAGHRNALPDWCDVLEADIRFLKEISTLRRQTPEALVHLAAKIDSGASMSEPGPTFLTNVAGSINLLNAAVRGGVKYVVFSSSASVYGCPSLAPTVESSPIAPASPYGLSKAIVEDILPAYERAYGLKWVALRFFNAAGAHPDASIGERHDPETHLIPLALRAADGRLAQLTVHGTDYPTPDGTCIRDYVHVCDLASAHVQAIEYLLRGGRSRAFNLGSGAGFSVREVIESVERVTDRRVPVKYGPRRPGDAAFLVADPTAARSDLGWQPAYPDLDTMVAHAWAWEQRLASMEAR